MKKFKDVIKSQAAEEKEIKALFMNLDDQYIVLDAELMEVYRYENHKTFLIAKDIIITGDTYYFLDHFCYVNKRAYDKLLKMLDDRGVRFKPIVDKFKDLVTNYHKIPLITYDMVTKPGMNYDKVVAILKNKAVQL